MSGHTPGPWRIEDKAAGRRVVKGDRSIVIIESWTTDPDARLIEAAPDLLAKLKELVNQIRDTASWPRDAGLQAAIDDADATIAKAEAR